MPTKDKARHAQASRLYQRLGELPPKAQKRILSQVIANAPPVVRSPELALVARVAFGRAGQ